MDDFWVIGDVAGEFDALLRLIEKLPKDANLIFVGDLNDRGPKTKEVIDFIRKGGYMALMGNHEHMFIDYVESRHNCGAHKEQYDSDCFMYNGGIPTLKSYLGADWQSWRPSKDTAYLLEDIAWLKERPLKFETENVIITHAPILGGNIEMFDKMSVIDKVWNRDFIRPNKKFQFFGHNGHYKEFFTKISEPPNDLMYAICVDDSRNDRLTAVHWPSLEKIQEKF